MQQAAALQRKRLMMKQFKIIVPSFNSVEYLPKTLSSIESQTYKNYQVCVIDDASTFPEQREIIREYSLRNHWKMRFHDINYGALYGLVHAINAFDCEDDDVIVIIDGDDWLAHNDVLKKLHSVYSNDDIWLTWGQCETYPPRKPPLKFAQPIPDIVIQQKLYRKIPFVFWHLATFKYFLWRHIKDEDLRDENGEYFLVMKDKATLFPMLEMAGKKIQFIPDTLYIYNVENPLNDFINTLPEEHKRVDQIIRNKSKYETLNLDK